MNTKITFALLIILSCFSQVWSADKALDPELEKQYWQFLKERLFDGESDIASRFQKNIYIYLKTDSEEDSSIVTNLLNDLQALIANTGQTVHPIPI